jgi:hypothetical protein
VNARNQATPRQHRFVLRQAIGRGLGALAGQRPHQTQNLEISSSPTLTTSHQKTSISEDFLSSLPSIRMGGAAWVWSSCRDLGQSAGVDEPRQLPMSPAPASHSSTSLKNPRKVHFMRFLAMSLKKRTFMKLMQSPISGRPAIT